MYLLLHPDDAVLQLLTALFASRAVSEARSIAPGKSLLLLYAAQPPRSPGGTTSPRPASGSQQERTPRPVWTRSFP